MVKGDSKKRHNNLNDLAELDDTLSNNFIGKIINKSQIINSYMWNCKHKKLDESLINKLYDTSSMLSSLSQIELDKAKKSFDNISMAKELKRINDMKHEDEYVIEFDIEYLFEEFIDQCIGEITEKPLLDKNGNQKINKKMIVPNFFNYVAQDNTYRSLICFETPMDYLEEIIDSVKIRNKRKQRNIGDMFVKANKLEQGDNNTKQHEEILKIAEDYSKKIGSLFLPKCPLNNKAKMTIMKDSKELAISNLSKLKINAKTIYALLHKCFGEGKRDVRYSKVGMSMLNLLYYSHTLKVLSAFRNINNSNEMLLVKAKNGDINIFGEKYIMIKRDNLIK